MHCGCANCPHCLRCSVKTFDVRSKISLLKFSSKAVMDEGNLTIGNVTMNSSSPTQGATLAVRSIPHWVSSTILAVSLLLFISNCTSLSLLLRFLHKSAREDRTPSQTFIVCIATVSLLASFFGIPACFVAASLQYKPARLATTSRFIQSRVLFLCFALVQHYLTCIMTERYLTITSRTNKITVSAAWKVAGIVTLYVFIAWVVIIIDDVCDIPGSSSLTTCSFEDRMSPAYSTSSRVPLAIITIWMSSCHFISCFTTARTIVFIKKVLKDSERRLGVSTRRVETRRMTIVYLLCLFYTIIWVPYGVVSAQREKMDRLLGSILELFFEIICYISFLAVPFAFYVLDKRFREYIKSLRKGLSRTESGLRENTSSLNADSHLCTIENRTSPPSSGQHIGVI